METTKTNTKKLVATTMFVDIVGFSRTSENMDAEQSFAEINAVLSMIGGHIKSNKGVIDRCTGDGLIAFFSDTIDGITHEQRALTAAMMIQKESANQAVASGQLDMVIYPLRIGIASGTVAAGMLGNDSTIIGHSVNVAKRLETACDGFSIMVAAETLEHCDMFYGMKPRERYINIKHKNELVCAYECNPFETTPKTLDAATNAYRKFIGAERFGKRYHVPQHAAIEIATQNGEGLLLNFSNGGICLQLGSFLGCGVAVDIDFSNTAALLKELMHEAGIFKVRGHVRWARPDSNNATYRHGILIEFAADQGERFEEVLKLYVDALNERAAA